MKGLPQYFDDLVQEIAEKSFAKHVAKLHEFDNPLLGPPLNIKDTASLARHVRHVLLNPLGISARLSESRLCCYDRYSNTLVVLTPDAKKPGTCYRPDARGTTFQKLLEQSRSPETLKRPQAFLGGIYALFPDWRGQLQMVDGTPPVQQRPLRLVGPSD